MKKRFLSLTLYSQVVILSFVTLSILSLGFIPLFLNEFRDIPQGCILGGLVSIIPYLLLIIVSKKEEDKKSLFWTIFIIALRFVLIGGTLVLSTLMYYYYNIRIFNVFSLIFGYLIPLIWLIIINLTWRKNDIS